MCVTIAIAFREVPLKEYCREKECYNTQSNHTCNNCAARIFCWHGTGACRCRRDSRPLFFYIVYSAVYNRRTLEFGVERKRGTLRGCCSAGRSVRYLERTKLHGRRGALVRGKGSSCFGHGDEAKFPIGHEKNQSQEKRVPQGIF